MLMFFFVVGCDVVLLVVSMLCCWRPCFFVVDCNVVVLMLSIAMVLL